MRYRELGKTGLMVSEIGLGAEWLERHDTAGVKKIIDRCAENGINILDCWMSEPNVRSNIGLAIEGSRDKWIIQGHIGSAWIDGQYKRTREMSEVKTAFEDLLTRMRTDYVDLGMIHFVDETAEFESIISGSFYEYVEELKASGKIRHIGMSTHSPKVAKMAAESGKVEMIMFSVNPAFDMIPANGDVFADQYDESLGGIDAERAELYRICEQRGIGITVMKGYAGGRLFNAETSPFGVALTPIQCLHYALTRPAVASVMAGFNDVKHVDEAVSYENASEDERDYASVLANAPHHAYGGQCTYCGHCAPCPVEIDIAMVNKLLDLAKMQDETPASLREHYNALSANASDCIGCAGCEERCPFHVNVVERMQEAVKIFA